MRERGALNGRSVQRSDSGYGQGINTRGNLDSYRGTMGGAK